jgi:hypothetical protein
MPVFELPGIGLHALLFAKTLPGDDADCGRHGRGGKLSGCVDSLVVPHVPISVHGGNGLFHDAPPRRGKIASIGSLYGGAADWCFWQFGPLVQLALAEARFAAACYLNDAQNTFPQA